MSGNRYWPGFFYAPFYTTNIFTDHTTPAGKLGLLPEYRVVAVNRQLMEKLYPLTAEKGATGKPIALLWEVGPGRLDFLTVPVEKLEWERVLEKYGVFLLSSLLFGWLAWRGNLAAGWAGLFCLAAADYWFNPGAGRLSGFDPASWWEQGQGGLASAKWSVFLYAPLGTLLWAALSLRLTQEIESRRVRQTLVAICLAGLLAELASYSYDAIITAIYNNPNFVIFHARTVFWGWLLPLGLAGWGVLGQPQLYQKWLQLAGLIVFVAGYVVQTTFDRDVVGFLGAQWFIVGLALAVGMKQANFKPASSLVATKKL